VAEALACLADAGLLEDGPAAARWSRREVVRRVGIGAALLLPVVASVVAPTRRKQRHLRQQLHGQARWNAVQLLRADPCTQSCASDICQDGGGC